MLILNMKICPPHQLSSVDWAVKHPLELQHNLRYFVCYFMLILHMIKYDVGLTIWTEINCSPATTASNYFINQCLFAQRHALLILWWHFMFFITNMPGLLLERWYQGRGRGGQWKVGRAEKKRQIGRVEEANNNFTHRKAKLIPT